MVGETFDSIVSLKIELLLLKKFIVLVVNWDGYRMDPLVVEPVGKFGDGPSLEIKKP